MASLRAGSSKVAWPQVCSRGLLRWRTAGYEQNRGLKLLPSLKDICCHQDKKEELRVEQVQAVERSTELETLLSTNLLKEQQELRNRLSSADVSADRCAHMAVQHPAAAADASIQSNVVLLAINIHWRRGCKRHCCQGGIIHRPAL